MKEATTTRNSERYTFVIKNEKKKNFALRFIAIFLSNNNNNNKRFGTNLSFIA